MNGIVLVTGGTGFIGRETVRALQRHDSPVRVAVRKRGHAAGLSPDVACTEVGNIGPATDWSTALDNVDVVVHLAARAHIFHKTTTDSLSLYRSVNTQGTLQLAREAAKAGVRRFVYVSSIGVNGSVTRDKPFSESDKPSPASAYAVSKWEAEQGLMQLQEETGVEVVVVRPPAVYGPGAPGNIQRLIRLIQRGIPLPLASVTNLRSFVSVENLADLLVCCSEHQAAAGELFLAADGVDVSTPQLIEFLAEGLGCHAHLWSLPLGIIRLGANIVGGTTSVSSLCSSLQVDVSKAVSVLGWNPSRAVAEGMRRTAYSYRESSGYGCKVVH